MHCITDSSDTKFLTQNITFVCQETVLCHLLLRGVAFVSTHPLCPDLSHSLRPAVLTLVRPPSLSNIQMTCKLIFWTDASFCINLILWTGHGIRFASISCLSRLSQCSAIWKFCCATPSRILQLQILCFLFASKITVTVLVPLRHHVPTEIWLGNLNRCEKLEVTIRRECV